MKIVIIGPAYPLRGGIAHHTALLAKELGKSHHVEVITFKRQYPALLFPGTSQKESGGELLRVESAELIDSINPLNWIRVGRIVRAKNPDLIIFAHSMPFFGPCFGTIAAVAKRKSRARVLFLCHNIVPHEHRPGDSAFTKFAFWFADYFLVQSHEVEQDLNKLMPGARYAVSPHPVYDMFGSGIPKEEARKALSLGTERLVLFFGYIRGYKGLGVLIDAMKEAVASLPDLKLLVVGEFYEDEAAYRRRVADAGLEQSIVFVSQYVPQEAVAAYFSAADAVILPYLSATQSGIAQVAYNFNKPVIATDVGGLAEVVRDGVTGFVVPPNNPTALADALHRFYDEQREAEFTRNVEKEKLKYSWSAMATAIETLVH
jgi:glycosyltransferase involved in cell wall biosynthesis